MIDSNGGTITAGLSKRRNSCSGAKNVDDRGLKLLPDCYALSIAIALRICSNSLLVESKVY
jgi:hypothetical protein